MPERLNISRAELCCRIGIAKRSGDHYAHGTAPVPKTVALAIIAVTYGLQLQQGTEQPH